METNVNGERRANPTTTITLWQIATCHK